MPVLTFRIDDPERVISRAAARGLSVSEYLRDLVERDLLEPRERSRPNIEDLIGCVALGRGSDSASIRRRMKMKGGTAAR